MNFEVQVAPFGSLLQIQSIGLRFDVLRKPLGLQFDAADLSAEENEIHIVAVSDRLVCGCLLLKPLNSGEIKMRQVAVIEKAQGKGIGKKMVEFSEAFCRNSGYTKITLHAREEAVKFYTNMDYQTEGPVFTEVGINHRAMFKAL